MKLLLALALALISPSLMAQSFGGSSGGGPASISGQAIAPSAIAVGAAQSFSSAPVVTVCAPVIVGTLASGSTFMAFTPDAAITLIRITTTIEVVGIIGGGDAVKCNNAAGTGLTATSAAGAAVGTVTTAVGSAAIAYQGTISCHIDSTASTRPILTACLEYVMQ